MREIELGKTGEKIPVIGQGTWGISHRDSEETLKKWKDALNYGIEIGMTMIDTAEIYGYGASERLVGEIIKVHSRDDLFIASKVIGFNYGYRKTKKACERSLKKLGIDVIDLYQLHWPMGLGTIKGTLKACEELVKEGKIRYIGVSNFTKKMLSNAMETMKANEIVSNQIFISIIHPTPIKKQLSFAQEKGVTLIAWSPFGHNGFKKIDPNLKKTVDEIASSRNCSFHQIALAFLTSHERIMTIPKSTSKSHIKLNAEAADIILSQEELQKIYKVINLEL